MHQFGGYTSAGVKIGSYQYDAWGNCTESVASGITAMQRNIVRNFNPFRYRGYYYDVETSLYYLQSRYYDPGMGRFLNADGYVNANGDMIGFNMHTYCSNKPSIQAYHNTSKNESTTIIVLSGVIDEALSSISLENRSYNQVKNYTAFQIPTWLSSTMSATDFGLSIAPAIRTLSQYLQYPELQSVNKLYGLDYVPGKLNSICSTVSYVLMALNAGLTVYSNISNDNLTTKQKQISIMVDLSYMAGTWAVSYAVGSLAASIPYVGPFVAPLAAAGTALLIDKTDEWWGWKDALKQALYD